MLSFFSRTPWTAGFKPSSVLLFKATIPIELRFPRACCRASRAARVGALGITRTSYGQPYHAQWPASVLQRPTERKSFLLDRKNSSQTKDHKSEPNPLAFVSFLEMYDVAVRPRFPRVVGAVQQHVFGPLELFTVRRLLFLTAHAELGVTPLRGRGSTVVPSASAWLAITSAGQSIDTKPQATAMPVCSDESAKRRRSRLARAADAKARRAASPTGLEVANIEQILFRRRCNIPTP